MSDDTPRLKLGQLADAQELDAMAINDALIGLDAFNGVWLLSQSLTAPPGSPADGDMYLLGAAPTGGWSGYAHAITYCLDGGWRFFTPFAGLCAGIADEGRLVVYTGSGWADFASKMVFQNLSLLGINTSADTTNRLAVKSAALLFDNVGNGVQAKLNKHAGSDTASLLLQDNYSGRAEFGLCGDDDLHLKVSPDGASWKEAMHIVGSSGAIGLNTAPLAPLHLHTSANAVSSAAASTGDAVLLTAEANSALHLNCASDTGRFSILAHRARGSFAALSAVQTADKLFSFIGGGFDGSVFQNAALIDFLCDGTPSSGHVPVRISFTTGTCQSDRAERVTVNSAGLVGIGVTPVVLLDVGGPVRTGQYTVSALPPATAGAGQQIFVSNESGGAVMAFSDGTNWRRVTDRAVVS